MIHTPFFSNERPLVNLNNIYKLPDNLNVLSKVKAHTFSQTDESVTNIFQMFWEMLKMGTKI